MKVPDSAGLGALISLPLGFGILFLDLWVGLTPTFGDWGALSLVIPFAIYFGLAGLLATWHHPQIAKGLAIGGSVVSLLIVGLILFFALMFSAATEFG
ncbi:MAG: hypothetical protein HY296_07640 [Thaumarchaeota archaeon]|nr:hypothetical protein [Nitrososphaerota archaeon]